MFRVTVNDECETQVIINFEEMVEFNDDCLSNCIKAIYSTIEKFKGLANDHIAEPQDYYYTIDCLDENQASDVEDYLYDLFENIQDNLEEDYEDDEFEDDDEDFC